jgi:AraC family transcriptional regulator
MLPRIATFSEKRLAGKRIRMSLAENRTRELWQSFMPKRREISNKTGPELFSVEVYDDNYFEDFNPEKEFEKWAALEVIDFTNLPPDMELLLIPGGLYAVFIHKGPASGGEKTFRYIFETWLPGSPFLIDNRPHFAVMGEKYKKDDPDSEEEIWIPVRKKA